MNSVEFQEIRIKMPELRTWFSDREIYPSLSELRLLMILLTDPWDVFTHDELITRMNLTSLEALQQLVYKLRNKLDGKYILSVSGTGYAFTERRN